MLQRQGEIGQDGAPIAVPRQQRSPVSSRNAGAARPRLGFVGYFHEVRNELRKVNWPSRSETRNYSIVVLVTLVVMLTLIFVLDYIFSDLAVFLFK